MSKTGVDLSVFVGVSGSTLKHGDSLRGSIGSSALRASRGSDDLKASMGSDFGEPTTLVAVASNSRSSESSSESSVSTDDSDDLKASTADIIRPDDNLFSNWEPHDVFPPLSGQDQPQSSVDQEGGL